MRKVRFTEYQIIAVLKSVEVGRVVQDVCREAGISEASFTTGKRRLAVWKSLISKSRKIWMKKSDYKTDSWRSQFGVPGTSAILSK